MISPTGNAVFDAAVLAAERIYQNSMTGQPTQAAATAADITRLKAIVAAGLANGISVTTEQQALRALGAA